MTRETADIVERLNAIIRKVVAADRDTLLIGRLSSNDLKAMRDAADAVASFTAADAEMREALEKAEEIAWEEASKQLALFDAGENTYGHHAAEHIAKAIRALATPSPRETTEKNS